MSKPIGKRKLRLMDHTAFSDDGNAVDIVIHRAHPVTYVAATVWDKSHAKEFLHGPKAVDLLQRIYTECDERDGGGDARFSAELYVELGRFMKEMQK